MCCGDAAFQQRPARDDAKVHHRLDTEAMVSPIEYCGNGEVMRNALQIPLCGMNARGRDSDARKSAGLNGSPETWTAQPGAQEENSVSEPAGRDRARAGRLPC